MTTVLPLPSAGRDEPAIAGGIQRGRGRAGMTLAAPAALLLLVLLILPSALVILFSLTDYGFGASSWRFVALDNYAELFGDPGVLRALGNTATYIAVVVPGSVALGLGAALLIEGRLVLRRFYRVALFLPVTATLVALATAWEVLLHPGFGLANLLLAALGQPKLRFLADPDIAMLTLSGIGIWQLAGFNMVLFLSGLASIPRELYDAAAVDGAARGLDRFRLVTWPMLGPTTMFVVVVTAIRGLQVFDTVAVLTRGGPAKATEVLLYAIYVEGFRYFRIGYASALTVVFLALATALTLAQARLMDRKVHYQ